MNRLPPRVPRRSLLPPLLAASLLLGPPLAAGQDSSPGAARPARGQQYFAEDDFEKALKEIDAALGADPLLAPAYEAQAGIWLAAKDLKKAEAAARLGLEKCPGRPGLLLLLGKALLAEGNPAGALTASEQALALPGVAPAPALRLKAEATALLETDGVEAGLKILQGALAKAPAQGALLEETGGYLLAHERPAEAIPLLKRAVEAEPRRVEPRLLLVRALLRTKDLAGAREAAQAAVDGVPESAEARNLLGRTFEEAADLPGALPLYEQAARMRPRRAPLQVDYGYALARTTKWKEAGKVLAAAIRMDGTDLEARFHFGWVLNREGDLGGALDQYNLILKGDPVNRRALWNAADLCVVLGKAKDAQQFLDRLLAEDPKHSEAFRLLALVHFRNGKKDDAKKALASSLEADARNARSLFLQGQIQEDDGDSETAEKSFLASAEADPKLPWPHLYLAEMYDEKLGRPLDALKSFRRYLELGGPDPDNTIQKTIEALEKETAK